MHLFSRVEVRVKKRKEKKSEHADAARKPIALFSKIRLQLIGGEEMKKETLL